MTPVIQTARWAICLIDRRCRRWDEEAAGEGEGPHMQSSWPSANKASRFLSATACW